MSVTLNVSGNEQSFASFVNLPVSSIFANAQLCESMNIGTDMTIEVSNNGGEFRSVTNTYIMQDGDEIVLTRPDGTKGMA